MPDKITTLHRLLIFPNTQFPDLGAYIITGRDIDDQFFFTDTDDVRLFKDYWSKNVTAADKVPVIQALLNCLHHAYGWKFRVIRALDDEELARLSQQ